MSKEDKALQEKNLGQEAHKRKDYEVAISHYSNAMKLNPKEMSFIYHLAKIHLEQKKYPECIRLSTKAIKVGKEQKANVKMVAKAMAMRGRAHRELGERDKYEEDVEKAVKFLSTIAQVKFAKEQWQECMDFSMKAYKIGKDNDFIEEDQCRKLYMLFDKAIRRVSPDTGCKDNSIIENPTTYTENLKTFGDYAAYEGDFESALDYYKEAARLNPKDIIFINKIATVKFEQGAYAECIEFCNKAHTIGEENGADPKNIEYALNCRGSAEVAGRAQKLLDNISEDLQTGLKLAPVKSVPLPKVREAGKFRVEIRRYFRAHRLDPFDLTDIYKVSLKLYEEGNFDGCILLCQNAHGKDDSRRLAKVRALQGKALRRDFGWAEDIDTSLADDMKTKGGASDKCITVETVQRILTDLTRGKKTCLPGPEDARLTLAMADVNGDRKISHEQIRHVAKTMSLSMTLAPHILRQGGLSKDHEKRMKRMCGMKILE